MKSFNFFFSLIFIHLTEGNTQSTHRVRLWYYVENYFFSFFSSIWMGISPLGILVYTISNLKLKDVIFIKLPVHVHTRILELKPLLFLFFAYVITCMKRISMLIVMCVWYVNITTLDITYDVFLFSPLSLSLIDVYTIYIFGTMHFICACSVCQLL